MPSWFDVDAPDTSWRGSSEDPIPVLLGRWPITAFLYRWFACRPLDGHARSNATLRERPSEYFTRTGNPPWPAQWHALPRWRQAMVTRMPITAYFFSCVAVLWVGGLDALGGYLRLAWDYLLFPIAHFVYWVVTLWL